MKELNSLLKELQQEEWRQATVSLYIVKRVLKKRQAQYSVHQVNVDESLRKKLHSIAIKRISLADNVTGYDFNTADLDNNMLGIKMSETDFQTIIDAINADETPKFITKYDQLVDTWLYIARLDLKGKQPIYSARQISKSWSTKKVNQLVNVIFQDNMLVDIEQENIFRIDGKVDFLSHNGMLFIADKKNFEAALNFREGMERNRDVIVEEFKKANIFVDADEINRLVGDNLKRLRKLSQIKKAGYYQDKNFLENLRTANDAEEWDIKYSGEGKIVVNEEDIDTVLRVLNNGRLRSIINDENFDVDVKHKIP